MASKWWELHIVDDAGGEKILHVDATIGPDWFTVRENTTQSVEFRFADGDGAGETLVVSNGETHTVANGELESYSQTEVQQGGTLQVNQGGTLITNGAESRWRQLFDFAVHAGQAAVDRSIDNTAWYADQLDSEARVNSLLMGIEPQGDLSDEQFDGFWGIVMGAQDVRTVNTGESGNQGTWHMTLDFNVLAPFSEHADVSAAQTAHEVT